MKKLIIFSFRVSIIFRFNNIGMAVMENSDLKKRIDDLINVLTKNPVSTGIKIKGSSNVFMSGNKISGYDRGIDIEDSSNITGVNNLISDEGERFQLIDLLQQIKTELDKTDKTKLRSFCERIISGFSAISPVITLASDILQRIPK